ncbi:hypothetical protein KR49_11810 [Synechococcus sp. KORDI-49]|nr:hypothetical protein KR49_11810 [Synechococcus sp. KORDI-49]
MDQQQQLLSIQFHLQRQTLIHIATMFIGWIGMRMGNLSCHWQDQASAVKISLLAETFQKTRSISRLKMAVYRLLTQAKVHESIYTKVQIKTG